MAPGSCLWSILSLSGAYLPPKDLRDLSLRNAPRNEHRRNAPSNSRRGHRARDFRPLPGLSHQLPDALAGDRLPVPVQEQQAVAGEKDAPSFSDVGAEGFFRLPGERDFPLSLLSGADLHEVRGKVDVPDVDL